jgi:hypothetical protein
MKTIRIAGSDWHEVHFNVPVVRGMPEIGKEKRFREKNTLYQAEDTPFPAHPPGIDPTAGARGVHCRLVQRLATHNVSAKTQ